MKVIKISNFLVKLTGILLLFVIVGCAPIAPEATDAAGETVTIPSESPETATPEVITATPATPTVILAFDSQGDPTIFTQTQSALEEMVASSGHTLVIQERLGVEMLTPNVEVVVGVGSIQNISELAAAAPEVIFITLDNSDVAAMENLSVIGDPGIDGQRQSFMAGYLAALVAEDYKVAVLVPSDSVHSELILESFVKGVRFFCGSCRPVFPPYNTFPQWETLSSENAVSGFDGVINNLVAKDVEILYVPDVLATSALLDSLEVNQIKVVGDTSPATLRDNWIGTVMSDPTAALLEFWPNRDDGQSGKQINASIKLVDTDLGWLSAGRYRLFEETIAGLMAGLISPGEAP